MHTACVLNRNEIGFVCLGVWGTLRTHGTVYYQVYTYYCAFLTI